MPEGRRRTFLAGAACALLLLFATDAGAAGLLVPAEGGSPIRVRSHRITAEVTDGVARTTLRQTFVNPGEVPLEAVYLFPVPDGAALTGVAMETGGKRYEGLLVARFRARRLYNRIVHAGEDPALVEQVGANLFRLSVFPVLPGEETVVELSWVEHLPLTGGEVRWVYPLASPGTDAARAEDLVLDLTMRSGAGFAGWASNDPDVLFEVTEPGVLRARLAKADAVLDTDLVVRAAVGTDEPDLTVRSWKRGEEDGVFFAVLTPPSAPPGGVLPRDLVLAIDTSGSMEGEKLEQAKRSALYLLERLRPGDRVNVIGFGTRVKAFADAPVPATEENLAALRAFVAKLEAAGSTAFAAALEAAVAIPPEKGRVRSVLVVTDGRPTIGSRDPAELVKIGRVGGGNAPAIYPFGVGEDVDAGLLGALARATGGRAEVFRSGAEISDRVNGFLERTGTPVMKDVACTVHDLVSYEIVSGPSPVVHAGEQVAIVGRYRFGGPSRISVSGWFAGKPFQITRRVEFREMPGGERAVADLYAERRLARLEERLRLRLALPDDAYYEALDRNGLDTGGAIVREMIDTSLEFGIQCPFTAFIVLLPEDSGRVDPRDEEAIADAIERATAKKLADDAPPPDGAEPAPPEDPATKIEDEKGPASGFGTVDIQPPEGGEAPPPPPPPDPPSGEKSSPGGGDRPRVNPGAGSGGSGAEGEGSPAGNGGSFRGPAGDVPPGERGPDDPPPPREPPSSDGERPSPGGEKAGGDTARDDSEPPPSGETAPGLSNPASGPSRGVGKRSAPPPITFDSWLFWWAYNRDAIFEERAKLLRDEPLSPADPSVSRELVPPLLMAVANPGLPKRVRESALLAVARIGGDRVRRTLLRLSRPGDREGLTDAAITGLSLLPSGPDEEITSRLLGVLGDAAAPEGARARAAITLGLRPDRDPRVFAALSRLLEEGGELDLMTCSILALGLHGGEGAVTALSTWLTEGRAGERRLGDREQAWLLVALGRLGDSRALPAVSAAAGRRGVLLRAAIPLALGGILPRADLATQRTWVPRLERYGAAATEDRVRRLSLVALGRIAAGTGHPEIRGRISADLVEWFRDPKRRRDRTWVALAIGLFGDGASEAERIRLAEPILAAFDDRFAWAVERGAYAVALGLLRDDRTATVDRLVAVFTDLGEDKKLRGAAATALGLLGGDKARAALALAMRDRDDRGFRVDSAAALGVVGGRGAAPALAGIFTDERADRAELAAAANALGPHAGLPEVESLLTILAPLETDADTPARHRAMAAAALGAIGSRGAPRRLTPLTRDHPWRMSTRTLDALLDIP